MDDQQFDAIAERELDALEKTLGDFDPDELEVTLASGVLTLAFSDGAKVIVNSHRAAREIWMADGRATSRRAYHFAPHDEGGRWTWKVGGDELHATLARSLTEKLGRDIIV